VFAARLYGLEQKRRAEILALPDVQVWISTFYPKKSRKLFIHYDDIKLFK
jgi:hypothetical protein